MNNKSMTIYCENLSRVEMILLLFIEESNEVKDSDTITYQMVKDTLEISKRTFYHAFTSLRNKGLLG